MCQALLCDRRFHQLLLQFDDDLATSTRADGCRSCAGTLHSAYYRRKPRGAPRGLEPQYSERASFCCAVHGCRKRSTPPSLRFLGRKVYLATMVVLVSAMRCGLTPNCGEPPGAVGKRATAHARALALLVAGGVCRQPVLEGGRWTLHAAGTRRGAAGESARALQRCRCRGPTTCVAALLDSDKHKSDGVLNVEHARRGRLRTRRRWQ